MNSSHKSYVSLEDNNKDKKRSPPPPPPPRDHGGCCCWFMSCICWCLCFMLLLCVIFMAAVAIMYFIFRPQIPVYGIDSLQVKAFEMRNDSKLYTEMAVVVRCENPNKKIGFKYGEDNSVSIIYSDGELCAGKFESFLQAAKSTVMINMTLKGEREVDSKEKEQFMAQQKEGKIPLVLISNIPVTPVIGGNIHELWNVSVRANCLMVVDNIQKDKTPNISHKECTFAAHFWN
ncbi:NDR1/HIN1-like protein 6 [Arachis duranensis]|uniref:NDR1/HIN1-like protein 6 n=1 Tax=Arachis duranensis TaxID=130453 RepID=A0A6P4BDX8_ARADU|nr:NDR1/HIN1-like protein 6 [Arachis duranensis]